MGDFAGDAVEGLAGDAIERFAGDTTARLAGETLSLAGDAAGLAGETLAFGDTRAFAGEALGLAGDATLTRDGASGMLGTSKLSSDDGCAGNRGDDVGSSLI